ncbi:MAG: DUF4382 domain-containing protein [Caldimonas sp.]
MNPSYRIFTATALAVSAVLAACGGGSTGDSGTLRLALTDAPACGFDRVDVTVQKVRVHKSNSANENDDGWSEVVLQPAKRIDLLSLTNGVLAELGQTALPAGKYNQMRFVLAPNGVANPLANSVTPTGGTEVAVATPSGAQSGLKMNIDIDVEANTIADFALDFDTCRSFVRTGNGAYTLKPVIAVIPRISEVARVTGQVALPIATTATSVSLQLNGAPVRSTPPDSTGKFVLYPVPVGVYDLVVTAPGRVIATITGVPVSVTSSTTVNLASAPIDPPASPMRSASGTISTGVSPVDAVASVRKQYVGGPVVMVARGPVHGTTGAFSYALPASAPVRAAFAASAPSMSFTTDSGAPTGKYTLVGTAGTTTKTLDFDLSLADFVAPTWAFP